MPYKVEAGEDGSYDVINTETDEIRATHEPPDAKEKAEAQVKLLHEIEADPAWNDDPPPAHHAGD